MIDLRLLVTLNVAMTDDEWLSNVNRLADMIENGTVAPRTNGDLITSLRLTPYGSALLSILPAAAP